MIRLSNLEREFAEFGLDLFHNKEMILGIFGYIDVNAETKASDVEVANALVKETDALLPLECESKLVHTDTHAFDLDFDLMRVRAFLDLAEINMEVIVDFEVKGVGKELLELQRDVLDCNLKVGVQVPKSRDRQDSNAVEEERKDDDAEVVPYCLAWKTTAFLANHQTFRKVLGM